VGVGRDVGVYLCMCESKATFLCAPQSFSGRSLKWEVRVPSVDDEYWVGIFCASHFKNVTENSAAKEKFGPFVNYLAVFDSLLSKMKSSCLKTMSIF